jgi:hypothetical protein
MFVLIETEAAMSQMNFEQEFGQRLDELCNWAKASAPDNFSPDFAENLAELEVKLRDLVHHQGDIFKAQPEPEQGGPQYVNVTAAPWP